MPNFDSIHNYLNNHAEFSWIMIKYNKLNDCLEYLKSNLINFVFNQPKHVKILRPFLKNIVKHIKEKM